MNRILLLFFAFIRLSASAVEKTDSLLAELKNHNSADSTRLNILYNIAYTYSDENPESGLRFAHEALDLAHELDEKLKMAKCYMVTGLCYKNMEQDSNAILSYQNGITLCKAIGENKFQVNLYNNLGNALFNLSRYQESIAAFEEGAKIIKNSEEADAARLYTIRNNESTVYLTLADYPTALKCLFDAATAAERMKDSSTLMDIYINISIAYRNIPDYPTSLKYAEKSMMCCQRGQNKKKLGSAYMTMGNTLDEMGKPNEAVEYYHKSRELSTSIGDKRGLRKTLINLGVMYSRMNNYDSAYYYFQQCENMLRESGDRNDLSIVFNNLASILDDAPPSFLIRNHINPETKYVKAADFALKGLQIGEELEDQNNQLDSWQTLASIYKHAGNYEKAFEALENSIRLNDSILSTDHLLELGSLQSKYEYQKKESDLKLAHEKEQAIAAAELQSQVKINSLMTVGGIMLLLAGAGGFILYKRRRDAEEKQSQAEIKADIATTEMKALRAQMNPHFIFNSLNSISQFITTNDSKTADYFTIKFSKLMRMILENSEKKEVTLTEDLEALELYTKLESMRMKNKFTCDINIARDIDPDTTYIPPLILQPFVENSIWHGFSQLNENGKIEISFSKKDNMLQCVIVDNGIGRSASEANHSIYGDPNKKSMGMNITKARMDLLNKLSDVKASVQFIDLEKGLKVILQLPYITND